MKHRGFDIVGCAAKARTELGMRISIASLEDRIAVYERFVGWPALIESLKVDLQTIKDIYKERHGEYRPRFY